MFIVVVTTSPSLDEIDVSTRETTWYKKRKRDFEYVLPADQYSTVLEERVDVRGSDKRKIIALSDLHLGGSWATGMDWKLNKYMETLIETAKEEVNF